MLDHILNSLGFDSLNPMQEKTLEASRSSDNLLLLSPTGSGKTLAFLLPIVENLTPNKGDIQGLIIVPSRELGLQIAEVFKAMKTNFKVTVVYGGHEVRIERNNLLNPPAVLIGTPGRLLDHIQKGNVDLTGVKFLVLDEFDKSLEFGFESEMIRIMDRIPQVKKRILTSATQTVKVPSFVGLRDYVKLDYSGDQVPQQLSLKMVRSLANDKFEAVVRLLGKLGNEAVLVFCNHKAAVSRISELLKERGLLHVTFHGDLDQDQRERALVKFRNGSVKIMVTTDLAARGLDIPEVRHVVHYQLPSKEDAFIHRNGRTARMDATGTAYLVLSENEALPGYLKADPEEEVVGDQLVPEQPDWSTIYISGGKKDKINKVDIVGWLIQKGHLDKNEVGMIEIKDFGSYVAIKREKVNDLISAVSDKKLKKKKVKIQVAK